MKTIYPPFLARLLGVILIAAAIFGLLLSAAGIFFVWTNKTPLANRAVDNLEFTLSILETTEEGLLIIGDSLGNLGDIVNTLEGTLVTFGTSVADARPLVLEIQSIIGNDIPDALNATKTSVESAEASAEIVDTILRTITSIPFFPGEPYAPDVPLNVALGNVAVTLASLPDSLAETDDSLADLDQNLQLTEASLETLAADIGQMRGQLDDAELVIVSYQSILRDLTTKIDNLIEAVPNWANTAALLLTVILIWIIFTQVGLLTQGINMFTLASASTPNDDGEPDPSEA